MDEMIINSETMLFCDYYKQWIMVYKEGAIRDVTLKKYYLTNMWLDKVLYGLSLARKISSKIADTTFRSYFLSKIIKSICKCSRKTNNYGLSSSFKVCDFGRC